jgi:hypothetical protein
MFDDGFTQWRLQASWRPWLDRFHVERSFNHADAKPRAHTDAPRIDDHAPVDAASCH